MLNFKPNSSLFKVPEEYPCNSLKFSQKADNSRFNSKQSHYQMIIYSTSILNLNIPIERKMVLNNLFLESHNTPIHAR